MNFRFSLCQPELEKIMDMRQLRFTTFFASNSHFIRNEQKIRVAKTKKLIKNFQHLMT